VFSDCNFIYTVVFVCNTINNQRLRLVFVNKKDDVFGDCNFVRK